MKLSTYLLKLSSFIQNPYQKDLQYKKLIYISDEYIYIINTYNTQIPNNLSESQTIQQLKKQILKHADFIETKIDFEIQDGNNFHKYKNFNYIYGKYMLNGSLTDELKKIIAQWKDFGYKNNLNRLQQGATIFTQNSVY